MRLVRALFRNQRRSSCEVVRVCNHFPYSNRPLHMHKYNDPFKVGVLYFNCGTQFSLIVTYDASSPTATTARVHTKAVNMNCGTQFSLIVTYDAE
jgi:hypothetical protein